LTGASKKNEKRDEKILFLLVIFRCKIRIRALTYVYNFYTEHQLQPRNEIFDFMGKRNFSYLIVGHLILQKGVTDFVFYSDNGDRYRSFFIPNTLAESEGK